LVFFEGADLIDEQSALGAEQSPVVQHFGGFRLDAGNALLTDGSRSLDLPPKAFAVLCHLAAHAGRLVTKDQLLDAVWGSRFVSESVLKSTINLIRHALGDDARAPRFIETVARRGYRFVGMSAAGALAAPDLRAQDAPLIGRIGLIEQLAEAMAAANGGQRQMVFLGGAAGIGKSMLIRHVADAARARGETVAVGQCVEQVGGGEPYLPVLDALAELARGAASSTWLAGLRQAAPTWLAQLPWLASGPDQARLRHELAGAAQDRMLREFGALLDLATAERPLLLVIEDLHWSDHATVSLLDYLARRRGPARWMLLASFRPADLALNAHPMLTLRHELQMHKLCRELLLTPFDEREVDEYLLQRLGGRVLGHHVAIARALHRHTEGLPLFLAHVVDDLQDDPAFVGSDDHTWAQPAAALARLQLPLTVVASIERQIGRLPGELRDLLEAASVLGLEFDHLLLAGVLGQEPDLVRGRCDGLVRRGDWLRGNGIVALDEGEIGGRYAFAHALYRRVFHERCAPARRLPLHLRTAQVLQTRVETHGERAAAELAQHFESARDTALACGIELASAARDAGQWRIRAARAAVAVHAPADALAHYALAERCGLGAAERVRVHIDSAILHQQLGGGATALARNDAALGEARRHGEAALLQEVLLQRAQLLQRNDRHDDAIACVDELLAVTPAPSAAHRSIALVAKADALDCLGRFEEADAIATEAMTCLPADADADATRARYLAGRIAAHHHRGQFESGLRLIDDALALYERTGDAVGASIAVNRRGTFLMLMGRSQEAEASLFDAHARSKALNDVLGQRGALLNLVKLRTDRGDAVGSLELLEAGWRLSPSFESPVTECAFLSGFYYCNYLRGDLGAAWRDASRVLASAESLSSVAWRAGSLVLVCGLHIHLGDFEGARALIDQALTQSNAAAMPHIGVQAQTHAAWLDVAMGDPAQALSRLAGVHQSVDTMMPEDVAGMARVRAEAQLALGEPQAACQTLASYDGAPTQEIWALMLALRLRAKVATGGDVAADVRRALEELADSRVPALESTVLRKSLAAALAHSGRSAAAAEQLALLASHRDRLSESLSGEPGLRDAFVGSWS
jgi:DNA-binding winged helix-turn-helix (wHTH) protein/tetratricopeptide (TPR) repeat protein